MEINGVAHTFITAGNFAAARAFYGQLLPFLGLSVVADSENTFYCVGGRTGFGVHAPAPEYAGQRFRQGSVGLHHHCFRARERGDVDAAHDFLVKIGAKIVHEPREDGFAPGYYSVLFEDPDMGFQVLAHINAKARVGAGFAAAVSRRLAHSRRRLLGVRSILGRCAQILFGPTARPVSRAFEQSILRPQV